MDKNKAEQENLCLQAKYLCDLLRTKLFEIDTFSDYEKWNKRLKSLKKQLDNDYWEI